MLFKLLFTLVAVLWIIQAFRPHLENRRTPPPPPPGKPSDDDGDYIDYEEIK